MLNGDLATFPAAELAAGTQLARIHRAARAPWWFGSAGSGRFDLRTPLGTCYLAVDAVGAFIEVFDGLAIVPEVEVDARRLSWLTPTHARRLADLTSSRCRGFGLTAEVHSSPDRAVTQAVAAELHAAGFDGVRHLLRNDPAQRQVGIALFDDAGAKGHPVAATIAIPLEVRDLAAATYGIETLP